MSDNENIVSFNDTLEWAERKEKESQKYIKQYTEDKKNDKSLTYVIICAIGIITFVILILIFTNQSNIKRGQTLDKMKNDEQVNQNDEDCDYETDEDE
jgi:ligand-binding sensor protein